MKTAVLKKSVNIVLSEADPVVGGSEAAAPPTRGKGWGRGWMVQMHRGVLT